VYKRQKLESFIKKSVENAIRKCQMENSPTK